MTAKLFVLQEERWKRRNAHAAESNAASAAEHADLLAREERTRVKLTRARMVQEAIDEALLNNTPCDYETIMKRVAEYETYLK